MWSRIGRPPVRAASRVAVVHGCHGIADVAYSLQKAFGGSVAKALADKPGGKGGTPAADPVSMVRGVQAPSSKVAATSTEAPAGRIRRLDRERKGSMRGSG